MADKVDQDAREMARELWWPHHASRTRSTGIADLDGSITIEFEDLVAIVAAARQQGLREAAEVARAFNMTDVEHTFAEPSDIAAAITALMEGEGK